MEKASREAENAADGIEARSDRTLAGVRVFIAEDEPMLLWALEDALRDFGCHLAGSATTVVEALDVVMNNVFDVAILDGHLADGDVQPVFALLVERGTPVVISSGSDRSAGPGKFENAIILQKPYKDAELEAALLTLMA